MNMIKFSKKDALTKLEKLIEQGAEISDEDSFDHIRWRRDARNAIRNIFGEHSTQLQDFDDKALVYSQRAIIESIFNEVMEYWDEESLATPVTIAETAKSLEHTTTEANVFIGHGRSPLWARLQVFLENDLGLKTVTYESETRAGESIVPILEQILNEANFAVLILTAEDEIAGGAKRARQNVIHEAGLFQGRLGFNKAILLKQEGVEDFSNVAGLQHISFNGDRIEQTFWEVQRVLKKQRLIQ